MNNLIRKLLDRGYFDKILMILIIVIYNYLDGMSSSLMTVSLFMLAMLFISIEKMRNDKSNKRYNVFTVLVMIVALYYNASLESMESPFATVVFLFMIITFIL